MKLILASNNAHKLREFTEILSPLGIEIVSQASMGCDFEVEENSEAIKVLERFKHKQQCIVCDNENIDSVVL